jgi:hypothetical protein
MSSTNLSFKSTLLKIPQIVKATVIAILVNYGILYLSWFLYGVLQLNPLMAIAEFQNLSNAIGMFASLTVFLLTARKIIPTPTQAAVQEEMAPYSKLVDERIDEVESSLTTLEQTVTDLNVAFALRPHTPQIDPIPPNTSNLVQTTSPETTTTPDSTGRTGPGFSINTKAGDEARKRQDRRKARRQSLRATSSHLSLVRSAEDGEAPTNAPTSSALPPTALPLPSPLPQPTESTKPSLPKPATPKPATSKNDVQDTFNLLLNAISNPNDPDAKDLKLNWGKEMTADELTDWASRNPLVQKILANPAIQKQLMGIQKNLTATTPTQPPSQQPPEEEPNTEEAETE